MPLPGLGEVSFYYDKENDIDKIVLERDRNIKLNHASSGLRSCIPLIIVFNYIVTNIHNSKRTKTPFEIIDFEEKIQYISTEIPEMTEELKENMITLKSKIDDITRTLEHLQNPEELSGTLTMIQEQVANILGYYSDYFYSQVIIEEPELNLFPKTQQELIYYMLEVLNKDEKDHQLILTTHSPFILFAINNCMLGGLVENIIPKEEAETLPSHNSWIDPSKVSIYEIHNGGIKRIQDEDGIIEDNYLNQAYKENSNEYLSMLNYYEDEE